VHRYRTAAAPAVDGLPAGEGVFLPCTFWLCDNYALAGRHDEARALFERLLYILLVVSTPCEPSSSKTT
jgi:GH15 family glucan-1,4-alpha-glucosidase